MILLLFCSGFINMSPGVAQDFPFSGVWEGDVGTFRLRIALGNSPNPDGDIPTAPIRKRDVDPELPDLSFKYYMGGAVLNLHI